jgi:RHS repeat-associated protein
VAQLQYYYSGKNSLDSVKDNNASNAGLVSGITRYTYDGNGNMLTAANTANTGQNKSFTYNILNLPNVVTVPNGTDTYTYDAEGNKLRRVSVIGGVTKTTDYIGGIEYDNSTTAIGFIQTEEGKAVPNGTTNYDYNYYLGDNLGNTRVTFGAKTAAAIVYQQDDYYPFGLEILRTSPVPNPKNEYLYNKKELQEDFTEYDYGARFYDPVIGRFTTIDRFAEKYKAHSAYVYTLDNPIKSIDINGDSVRTTGSTSATASMKNVIEAGIGNNGTVSQNSNGTWNLSQTDDQALNMTDQQADTYKALSSIISDPNTASFNLVDSKDAVSQSIAFGDNGTSSLSATPGTHTIDINDMKNLGTTGLETAQGMLGHELQEGYDIQVKGMTPDDAHKDAIKTEGKINGTTRLQRGPELDPAQATIKMQVFDGTNIRTVTIKLNGPSNWNFNTNDVQGNQK